MTREYVYEKMNEIFRNVFDDETIELHDETNAEDIDDWDSLEQINLIVAIENEFGMMFDMAEVADLANVGEMVDLILSKEEVLLDAGMAEIARKISFTCDAERDESALYSEQVPGGWLQVRPNSGGEETPVNIEALFNAVLKNKNLVKQLFEQKGGNDEQ